MAPAGPRGVWPVSDLYARQKSLEKRYSCPLPSGAYIHGYQFTIFALGQSVQVAQGRTNVVAEAMVEMVVERVPWPGGAQPAYYRTL